MFAAGGLAVAVVDAPSDRSQGMDAIFRMSKEHIDDIAAVVAHEKSELALRFG